MTDDAERLVRRLERERLARKEAERLLERKSMELYQVNRALQTLADNLEHAVNQRTAELHLALQKAETATRAKSEFLAIMSHEVRTPITGILGMAQLLEDSPLDAVQRKHLGLLLRSGEDLRLLVDEILDFSKIEAGKLELEDRDFELREQVQGALLMFQPTALAKGLRLEASLAPDLPLTVRGDSTRLRQILSNLLANAIKFSPQGEVHLSVQAQGNALDGYRLDCAVRDSGIGIAAARLDRLFKPFSQVDSSTTRQYGGTGLGLAICARLCEAMGGHIDVESALGGGSTFRFSVRLQAGQADTAWPAETAVPALELDRSLRVLVVDDHAVNRMLASTLMRRMGIEADLANDGSEGVERVRSGAYDLVFMDMQMPDMDGVQATRAIRAMALPVRPRIIALTANAFAADRQACIDAGMDDFLSKPYRAADLRAKLLAFSRPVATPPGAGASRTWSD